SWVRADVNTAHFVHRGWFASRYNPIGLSKGLWSANQYVYTRVNTRLESWAYRRAGEITAVSQKLADDNRRIGIDGGR
ncbi:glycosyltransferase, partial [Burkholderia pseudomallei]